MGCGDCFDFDVGRFEFTSGALSGARRLPSSGECRCFYLSTGESRESHDVEWQLLYTDETLDSRGPIAQSHPDLVPDGCHCRLRDLDPLDHPYAPPRSTAKTSLFLPAPDSRPLFPTVTLALSPEEACIMTSESACLLTSHAICSGTPLAIETRVLGEITMLGSDLDEATVSDDVTLSRLGVSGCL